MSSIFLFSFSQTSNIRLGARSLSGVGIPSLGARSLGEETSPLLVGVPWRMEHPQGPTAGSHRLRVERARGPTALLVRGSMNEVSSKACTPRRHSLTFSANPK